MKNALLLLVSLLCLHPVIRLDAASQAYVDNSWNSPLVYSFDNSSPAEYPTRFKAEFDKKNLYITVECSDPASEKLRQTPRNPVRGWPMCDSVEIFMDPPQLKKYVQLAVGVNGMFYDSRKNKKDTSWKYELKFAKKNWQVKFIIPFADLQITPAETGDVWRFNLCRNVRLSNNYNSTWAHVGIEFQNPAKFGTLTFGTPAAAAAAQKKRLAKMLADLEKELKEKNIHSQLLDKLLDARQNNTLQKIIAIREEAAMIENLKGL